VLLEVENLAVAEQVVAAINFIANSRASKEVLKSANILRSIDINALIQGEAGVGKTLLAKYILNAPIVDADTNIDNIIHLLSQNSKLIIKNFDLIQHIDLFEKNLKKFKTRIIATTKKNIIDKISDRFFSLRINIPPLRDRKEDIYPLAKKFLNEAELNFNKKSSIKLSVLDFSLKENCYSLKFDIYKAFFEEFFDDRDLLQFLQKLFEKKIGTKNDYRKNLYLYEIPLIKAGMAKFKSQLKISEEFGINRNTLRKKILEYNILES